MPPEFSLTGKTALITGAGRGIGAGIAEVFIEAGGTVVINALTDIYLGKLVQTLAERQGDRVIRLPGDATTPEGVAQLVERSVARAGANDILVNDAGDAIQGHLVPTREGDRAMSEAEIAKTLDLNLMSAIYCTRAVGEAMLQSKQGRIIHVSSFAALDGGCSA